MGVKTVENKEQFETETSCESLVVVDFYADWCGPCKMIAPALEKWSNELTDVKFIKVNVDDAEELAAECGITAMPTFYFYKAGKKIDSLTGANKDKLEKMIKELK